MIRTIRTTEKSHGEAETATIHVSREPPADKSHTSPVITPAAVYINGRRVEDAAKPVALKTGANPILVRYEHAGRGHFVMRRADCPHPAERAKLAMRWHEDPGVIPFDVFADEQAVEYFRFQSAPGTTAIRLQACGEVQALVDGVPM
jgi:hypothetical protein